MALFGSLYDFKSMFYKSEALQILHQYLLDAMDKNTNIYNRIVNLNCSGNRVENKIDLGFDMVAIEQSYKLGNEGQFESHMKYIDFQLVVSGSECMNFGSIGDFDIYSKYDSSRDIILYHHNANTSTALLKSGTLAVFFPYDVHKGGIPFNDESVYKSVIKVPSQLLKFCF